MFVQGGGLASDVRRVSRMLAWPQEAESAQDCCHACPGGLGLHGPRATPSHCPHGNWLPVHCKGNGEE